MQSPWERLAVRGAGAALLLLLHACAGVQVAPDAARRLVSVPGPHEVPMVTHLYLPDGAGPFPVVIFLHGRAPKESDRHALAYPVLAGHAHFWMRKGFAVVAPIRPGYGETGGVDLEDSHASPHGRFCSARPDYRSVAEGAAAAAVATLQWLAAQPWADTGHVILDGVSVGGLATIDACAKHLPGVVGCINFSGGAGGNPHTSPDRSCEPESVGALFHELGATATPPSLWLYAVNDHFWGPEVPRTWFEEFERGGGNGTFAETAAVSDEGHELLGRGGKLWGAAVNRFVERLGFAPARAAPEGGAAAAPQEP